MDPNDIAPDRRSPLAMTVAEFAELERDLGVKVAENAVAPGGARAPRSPRASGGAARDVWTIALQLAGRLGQHLGGGKFAVWCIGDATHTAPDGSAENARGSCALLPPLDGQRYGLPVCLHGHCAHLRFTDWKAAIGEDVWRRAEALARDEGASPDERRAEPAAAPPEPARPLVDLGDIIARAIEEKAPGLLFEPDALVAAVRMKDDEPHAFSVAEEKARTEVEGFKLTAWRDAVATKRRALKQAQKEEQRARAKADAAERREARARAAVEREEERVARRATEAGDRQEHHREATVDDVRYFQSPGRLCMETTINPGTERERVVVNTLSEFSAFISEIVMDVDSPDAKPRPAVYVLSIGRDEGVPYILEVPAERWAPGDWPEQFIARPGLGAYGRSTREHMRRAIEAMSPVPKVRYRYRWVGWARHEGRPVYLNADDAGGGAIDADGNVPGLRAEPPVERCNRFRIPPLAGFDVKRDVGALLYLLGHEPARIFTVGLGLTVRAAQGGARSAWHAAGTTGLGKSTVVAVFAMCFGPSFSRREPFLSWRSRGATVQGMLEAMSCARDVVYQIDDLQRTPESVAKATAVFPSHFEGVSQIKGRARGGALALGRSQGVIASSGETLPDEPSVRNRVQLLDLDGYPSPRLDEGPDCVIARGARGELARGMGRFCQWWAARYDAQLPLLPRLEREAAARWELGVDGRAAEVLGPAALGLDVFFAFVLDIGAADEGEVAAMRARAEVALREAAKAHEEHVATEAHWRRFLELVGQALRSGKGHALRGKKSGKLFTANDAPEDPTLWGWTARRSTTTTDHEPRLTTAVEPRGVPIGYVHDDKPGVVLLAPGAALRVALDLAREEGRPLHLDVSALSRELFAAGVLVDVSKGRAIGRKKWSWGSGDVEGYEIATATLWQVGSTGAEDDDPDGGEDA